MLRLVKKSSYKDILSKFTSKISLVNSNPYIMKRLCEEDYRYIKYAKKEAITPDLIDYVLEQVKDHDTAFLHELLSSNSDICHNSMAMKRLCEFNGKYFLASKGKGITFENFLIAINHPVINKRLMPAQVINFFKFSGDVENEELTKFCEYNGNFLSQINPEHITLDLIRISLTNSNSKNIFNIERHNHLRCNRTFMEKLCQIDGQYFMYAKGLAVDSKLLNFALNHKEPNKRLTLDRIGNNQYFEIDYKILKPLIEKDERWIKYADVTTLDEEGIIKKLKIDKKFVPISSIVEKFKQNPKVLELIWNSIDEDRYSYGQLLEIVSLLLDEKIMNDQNFNKIIKLICIKEEIDYDFFRFVLVKGIYINDEILASINPTFLQERYHKLYNQNNYERLFSLLCYKYIQDDIIRISSPKKTDGTVDLELGNKKIELLSILFNYLSSDKKKELSNWKTYYYKIISKMVSEEDLYNDIASRLDKLDSKLLAKLVNYTLENHQFELMNLEDFRKYDEIRQNWISTNLESDDLTNVKNAVLEKVLGISRETAQSFYYYYAEGVLDENSSFSVLTKEFFEILNKIMEEENILVLKNELSNINTLSTLENKSYLDLRNLIKEQYIEEYNKTLFKIEGKDKFDSIDNVDMYLAGGKTGKDKFNISLTAVGAYEQLQISEENINYKENWERPKMENHGICTSYIANNNMGVAKSNYFVLGFTDYEDDALLLAGPYDIFSKGNSFSITDEEEGKCLYLMPKTMIDNTRGLHNEMVMERIVNQEKRKPSYVVLVCDDYEKSKTRYLLNKICGKYNEERKTSNQEQNEEDLLFNAIKAAHDFSIPIVVVEREKIAKHEYKKIVDKLDEFEKEKDLDLKKAQDYFYHLITNLENNHSGNSVNHENINRKYFNKELSNRILNTINKKIVNKLKENPNKGLMLLEVLKEVSEKELEKAECASYCSIYDYQKIINFCQNIKEEFVNNNYNLSRFKFQKVKRKILFKK